MADPDPNFVATLYARNQKFTAWESVSLVRSYGTGYSQFQFSAAENAYGLNGRSLQIQPGDPVTIALAGKLAFTGYCLTRSGAFDKQSHSIVIAGVSKTFDLSHSSVVVKPGTYDGSTFQQAAQAAMAPHPVSLVMSNPPSGSEQPFASLSPQYGETVAAFISRIAAARNLFITDDPNGDLVAGQANPNAKICATMVQGQNIERCTFKLNDPSAFSWARLNGVAQATGSDQNWPTRDTSATATYPPARPNTFGLYTSEVPDDTQGLVTGLTHQAIRSTWPEIELDVTVTGWLRPDGNLWAPPPDDSSLVSIIAPMIFPNATAAAILAIQAVRFNQDSEEGTTTTLTLRRQGALTSAAVTGTPDTSASPSVSADQPDYQVGT